MRAAFRAFATGSWAVVRAPELLLIVVFATMLTVVPFSALLGREIRSALAHQAPLDLDAQEIDADWWIEYRRHASGLAATVTPAILGFAAPLDNLSALMDGTPRPWVLAVPVVVYAAVWAFLWGVLLQRFHTARRLDLRSLCVAGLRYVLPFAAISVLTGAAVFALFSTLHWWLFGPVSDAITARAGSESFIVAGRVALYLVFGALLATVSLAADYTRVALVVRGTRSLRDGLIGASGFLRTHSAAVIVLVGLGAAMFTLALVAYGVADIRFRGWRAVLLAQAFIIARLALRLVIGASQIDLYKRLTRSA